MRRWLAPGLILAAAWGLWSQFAPISRPPGILVKALPDQEVFLIPPPPLSLHGWTLTPLASYTLEARILSKAHYSDDALAELAPYDLAVGWGPMSDSRVLEHLDIAQSYRFYRWTCWSPDPPLPLKDITRHSANVHIIPATPAVLAQVRRLRIGSLVRLRGMLVEAAKPGTVPPMRSSLSRQDAGDGACEIMLVRVVQELD